MGLAGVFSATATLLERQNAVGIDQPLERVAEDLPGPRCRLTRIVRRVERVRADSTLKPQVGRVSSSPRHF